MSGDLRAEYDTLKQVAAGAAREADRVKHLTQTLDRQAENLKQGWHGRGAEAFHREMGQVLPKLKRLHHALTETHTKLTKISQIFQTAEQEAAEMVKVKANSKLGAAALGGAGVHGKAVASGMAGMPQAVPLTQTGQLPPSAYGIKFKDGFDAGWNPKYAQGIRENIMGQVQMTAHKLYTTANPYDKTPTPAEEAAFFQKVYGPLEFQRNASGGPMCKAGYPGTNSITLFGGFDPTLPANNGTIIHELGHYLDYRIDPARFQQGNFPTGVASQTLLQDPNHTNLMNEHYGYKPGTNQQPYLQHASTGVASESTADMFLNWVRGPSDSNYSFAGENGGPRQAWMDDHMPAWIQQSVNNNSPHIPYQ